MDDPLPDDPSTSVGSQLLEPTIIYVKPVVELLKTDVDVHGLAHITGGDFQTLKGLKMVSATI